MVQSPPGQSVSSRIFQGSVLGSMLLNVCINHLRDGTECTLSKFVDNSKLWGVVDNAGGQGCYSEGPGQAGEMHWQEPHEVQQRQVPSLVSATE